MADITDDQLIEGMFSTDIALARVAKRIFDRRHPSVETISEPSHCNACFEGCPKCMPDQFEG